MRRPYVGGCGGRTPFGLAASRGAPVCALWADTQVCPYAGLAVILSEAKNLGATRARPYARGRAFSCSKALDLSLSPTQGL